MADDGGKVKGSNSGGSCVHASWIALRKCGKIVSDACVWVSDRVTGSLYNRGESFGRVRRDGKGNGATAAAGKKRYSRTRRRSSLMRNLFAKKREESRKQGSRNSGSWTPPSKRLDLSSSLQSTSSAKTEAAASPPKGSEVVVSDSASKLPANQASPQSSRTPKSGGRQRRGSQLRSAVAAKRGWLLKKGGGTGRLARRNWKRRHFTVMDCELKYYNSGEKLAHSTLRGIVPMKGASVGQVESKYEFHFQVTHVDGRTLDLRAESRIDMDSWIRAIRSAIDATPLDLRTLKNSPKHKSKKNYSKYKLPSSPRAAADAAHRRMTITGDSVVPVIKDGGGDGGPSAAKKSSIRKSLRKHWLFDFLSKPELNEIMERMILLQMHEGESIFKEGKADDALYVISSGKCKTFRDGRPVQTLGVGGIVGELAMLYRHERTFSLVAHSKNVRVWRLLRKDYSAIVVHHAKEGAEHRGTFIRGVPLFQSMSEAVIMSVAEELAHKTFSSGERIIEQGGKGDEFFVLVSGKVEFYKRGDEDEADPENIGKLVGEITESGSHFGELALLDGEPRQATAVARGDTECFVLERNNFMAILGPVRQRLMQQTALKTLKAMKFFSSLEGSDIVKLSHAMTAANFDKGDHLTIEGNSGDSF